MQKYRPREAEPSIEELEFYSDMNPLVKLGLKMPDCRVYVQGEWLRRYKTDIACREEPSAWIYQVLKSGIFRISSEPVPGAIACWGCDDDSEGGFVAIVERVFDPCGDFVASYTSDAGWSQGIFCKGLKYKWTNSSRYIQGFIHPPAKISKGRALH